MLALSTAERVDNPQSYVHYFAAMHGDYSADELVRQPDQFVPLHDKPLRLGVHTHWYRIAVRNKEDVTANWFFSTGVSNPPLLRAYWLPETDGLTGSEHSIGTSRLLEPITAAHYAGHTNFSIQLQLRGGETGTLLIEYRSLANFPLTLRVLTPEDYLERNFKYTLLNGISLGAGLVLLLFFIVQYCLHPRPALGFYCLFILSTLLFMAQVFGYGWRFFFPGMATTNAHITSVAGSLIYVFYFLFCAYFFDLKQHRRRLFHWLLGCSALVGVLALMGLVLPTDFLLSLLVAAALPLPIFGALTTLPRHQSSVRFFLLGCCVHAGMTYLLLLVCLGVELGINVFALATAGQFIDALSFSAAILLHHRNTQKQLDWQLLERRRDMETLSSSEQLASQLRAQSRQTVLQAATSAHDLLQLLAAMRLQLATQNSADPVVAQLQATLALADELLRSRLQMNQADYWQLRENLAAEALLREIGLRHAPLFAARQLVFNVRAQTANITCLHLAVQRILDNLLSNALRHTSQGRVLLTGRVRGDGYLIQVHDTGPGIAQDHLQNLLQPFTQGRRATDSTEGGFGLGLFIVTQLCDSVGYRFTIQSRQGRGTCCSLFIPIHTEL